MPRVFSLLLATLALGYAALVPAHDANRSGVAPAHGLRASGSDAELLAERHFALYRAAWQARGDMSAVPSAARENGAQPVLIRTSATAALPLATFPLLSVEPSEN